MSDLEASAATLLRGVAAASQPASRAFSIFRFFRPNENEITQLLQHLLSPGERHSERDTFMAHLLGKLEFQADTAQVYVERNSLTRMLEATRYIDLAFRFKCGSSFAIENKPWAEDQPNQITDYLKDLEKRSPNNYMLLYLSGNGHAPPSISKTETEDQIKRNHLRVMSYPKFADCIRAAAAACADPYMKSFAFDLADYFRREFRVSGVDMNQLGEQERKVVNLCVDEKNVDAALLITCLRDAIVTRISQLFLATFNEKLHALLGDEWQATFRTQTMQSTCSLLSIYSGLYIYRQEWLDRKEKYSIGFCNHTADGGQIVFGIYKGGDETNVALDGGRVRENLDERFGGGQCGRHFNYWDWYFHLQRHPQYEYRQYSAWHTNQFLIRMAKLDQRTELATALITSFIKPVVEIAADAISRSESASTGL